jgi:acetylornithine deacetylase/succinyl-diaminopimelate desuccinylase-like protein
MQTLPPDIVDFVTRLAGSDRYAEYLRDTLVNLCAVNTAPDGDLAATAARERELFDRIQCEVEALPRGTVRIERPAIDPAIESDPAYTPPGYAADAQGHVPPAGHVYAGRTNMIVMVSGDDERSPVVQHAHVDVVPPWTPPRVEAGRVVGRGACDNEAQVAVLLAQMRLLDELQRHLGRQARCGRVYQFAIDEEIGGNGSLSLAMDPRFAGSRMIVHECTELVPYCAHRGCVYYRCRLSAGPGAGGAFGMFPYAVTAMVEEGRRFQAETRHPLFGVEHVQANPGRLGRYGTTPGTVCDHVGVVLTLGGQADPKEAAAKTERSLADSLKDYCRLHGDKTAERDAATGRPRLDRHFLIECVPRSDPLAFRIDFFGIGGHMGALSECDNAITKAACMLRGILDSSDGLLREAMVRAADADEAAGDVVIEGGQGFTPCHRMEDVKDRLLAAARQGAREYCAAHGLRLDEGMIEMSFDRLHNDAYAADPSIEPMQALLAAREAVGLPPVEVVGWRTSCDARLYHARGYPVAIFGAGRLDVAHSDHEYVDIADVQRALAISTLAVWAMIR